MQKDLILLLDVYDTTFLVGSSSRCGPSCFPPAASQKDAAVGDRGGGQVWSDFERISRGIMGLCDDATRPQTLNPKP
jgi:hypothetical protein